MAPRRPRWPVADQPRVRRLLDLAPRHKAQAARRRMAVSEARLSDLANPEMAAALRVMLSRETFVRVALGEMDTDGGAT